MSECLITGPIYDGDGTIAANLEFGEGLFCRVLRVEKGGTAVSTKPIKFWTDETGAIKSKAEDGTVIDGVRVLRGADVWIQAPVAGFDRSGGVRVSIPDAAEVPFRLLVPGSGGESSSVSQTAFNEHTAEEATARADGDAGTLAAAQSYTDDALAAFDLSAYQPVSQRNQANGYLGLDENGLVADIRLPFSIARDSEVTNMIAAEAAARTEADEALTGAVALKAPLDSPGLIGTPTGPTAPAGTNNSQLATTAFVHALAETLINAAPEALNQLNELADALGNDPNFATTVIAMLGGKAAKDANLSDLTDPAAAKLHLGLVKADVGLSDVDNTSDANKPVSTAQATAIATKQDADSDLTAIAALSPSNDDIIQRKSGAWVTRTLAQLRADLALQFEMVVAVSDETTAITTGAAKVTFRMPRAVTLTKVKASLSTASSSGLVTVDVNEGGVSIFSTALTIDANEKTSETAATAAVLSDTAMADDAEITIDVDGAGTGAKGLKVTLLGVRA